MARKTTRSSKRRSTRSGKGSASTPARSGDEPRKTSKKSASKSTSKSTSKKSTSKKPSSKKSTSKKSAPRKAGSKPSRQTGGKAPVLKAMPMVGLVVLDLSNPFFEEVARAVEKAVTEAGYTLFVGDSRGDAEKEGQILGTLKEAGVSGVIITPVGESLSHLEDVQAEAAVVLLDHHSPDSAFCSVAVDNVRGGEMVAEHLLANGHKRLGLLSGPRSIPQCADRREGMRAAVEAAGMDPDKAILEAVVPAMNTIEGRMAAGTFTYADDPPTAIFCLNDMLALGCLQALTGRGVDVPREMALIGYDDIEFISTLQTPLSTMRQPKTELGHAAARLLVEEMRGRGHRHEQLVFTPQLVARDSSRR